MPVQNTMPRCGCAQRARARSMRSRSRAVQQRARSGSKSVMRRDDVEVRDMPYELMRCAQAGERASAAPGN